MTPQEKEKAQINKIRKEKGEVRLTPQKYKGSQGIWANVRSKVDNLEKRDYSFLKKKILRYNLLRLNQEEKKYEDTNSVPYSRSVMSNSLWPHGLQHARLPERPIIHTEIESVI